MKSCAIFTDFRWFITRDISFYLKWNCGATIFGLVGSFRVSYFDPEKHLLAVWLIFSFGELAS
jgi:predicted branched-subunit amino acid permease